MCDSGLVPPPAVVIRQGERQLADLPKQGALVNLQHSGCSEPAFHRFVAGHPDCTLRHVETQLAEFAVDSGATQAAMLERQLAEQAGMTPDTVSEPESPAESD